MFTAQRLTHNYYVHYSVTHLYVHYSVTHPDVHYSVTHPDVHYSVTHSYVHYSVTHPDVHLGPAVAPPFEEFWSGVRRTTTVGAQQLPSTEVVTEPKV